MTKYLFAILLALSVTSSALAHDPSKHKGKPIQGDVTAIRSDGFTLKTTTEELRVTFSPTVKIERGESAGTRDDLTQGQSVHVIGTKLASGGLVAKEIIISEAPKGNSHHDAGTHGQEKK